METDDTGDAVLATYNYGNDLISAINHTLSTIINYYHYDGLGSVRQLTDDTEAVAAEYTYDAFGNLIASSGSGENSYGFTGEQQFNEADNLIFLRHRYYSPSIGRFISRDPFHGCIVSPITRNRYPYCMNNPVNFIDPAGLLATHGNWCGPGHSAGESGKPSESDWTANNAVDWLDQICKEHDACFQGVDPATGKSECTDDKKNKNKCNEEMCGKLLSPVNIVRGATGWGLENKLTGRTTYTAAIAAFCFPGGITPFW
ncbi:MAG: hypothetical protein KJ887_04980 [Candidatus Omnitrophica bacterium]|nr:hypothetical protein [Candidatus Omnitrophota bacterium]MBU1047031.1 hypothetical protein [Candidatus Omnitrophota bacterium]MBU1767265.1 hypothetical protein [Candidatus Omnitrophota bacterium]MBU1889299.1 hypothetical protein [Candidatus Omnitrophota bacterium]